MNKVVFVTKESTLTEEVYNKTPFNPGMRPASLFMFKFTTTIVPAFIASFSSLKLSSSNFVDYKL